MRNARLRNESRHRQQGSLPRPPITPDTLTMSRIPRHRNTPYLEPCGSGIRRTMSAETAISDRS